MHTMRFRSGQQVLRKVPVDSATVIQAGDLVWLDTDDAKPASAFTWDSSLGQTQENFAAKFLGVATEPSASGETKPISVDVGSDAVYEFACNSAAYNLGDPLGPDKASGNALLSDTLEAATAVRSIARAAETRATTTKLRVTFASAYHTASSNLNASVG